MDKVRLAVFLSGNGSNAEAIFKYFEKSDFVKTVLVLSNNPEAPGLRRAEKYNLPVKGFSKMQFRESGEVVAWLKEAGVTHVVLAGFLWLIPENLIKAYPHRIINIHPALLPKFGGKGMYGMKVHEAVKQSGEKTTGITIHVVDEKYDEGKIIFQAQCNVLISDTPEQISLKVQQLEHLHYPRVIEEWVVQI